MAGMSKKRNINLELLTDVDKLLVTDSEIRGLLLLYVNQYIDILKQMINT